MTLILAECDQKIVDVDPEFAGEYAFECLFGGFGVVGDDHPEPVRDAMDVGVDADRRYSESKSEYEVGGLSTHPGEFEEPPFVGWDLTVVPIGQDSTYGPDLLCLIAIKACRVDRVGDLVFVKTSDIERRGGEIEETTA